MMSMKTIMRLITITIDNADDSDDDDDDNDDEHDDCYEGHDCDGNKRMHHGDDERMHHNDDDIYRKEEVEENDNGINGVKDGEGNDSDGESHKHYNKI